MGICNSACNHVCFNDKIMYDSLPHTVKEELLVNEEKEFINLWCFLKRTHTFDITEQNIEYVSDYRRIYVAILSTQYHSMGLQGNWVLDFRELFYVNYISQLENDMDKVDAFNLVYGTTMTFDEFRKKLENETLYD